MCFYRYWRSPKVFLTSLLSSMRPMSLFFTTTGLKTFLLHFFEPIFSGRKTIRAFRRKDGKIIANFRVQVSTDSWMCCQMEAFPPGGPQGNGNDHGRKVRRLRRRNTLRCRSVVLGMGDGSMTTLTIADPDKEGMGEYLKSLPSRWLMRGKLCPTWLCQLTMSSWCRDDNVVMMLGWQYHDDGRLMWWRLWSTWPFQEPTGSL